MDSNQVWHAKRLHYADVVVTAEPNGVLSALGKEKHTRGNYQTHDSKYDSCVPKPAPP